MAFRKNYFLICLCASSIFLILFLFSFIHPEPINPDGIRYFQAVKAYLSSGMKASKAIFPWPFITLNIAYLHQLTSFSFEASAHLLNLFFAIIFIWSFIALVKIVSPQKSLIFIGLILALYPELNRTALLVTRDVAYWAMTTTSLLILCHYAKKPTWINAGAFGLAQCLATLYRAEGIIFLFALPFSLLFIPALKHRFFNFIRCQSILLLCVFFILFWGINHIDLTVFWGEIQRILDPAIHLFVILSTDWSSKVTALQTYVLEPTAKNNGALVLIGGSVFIFLNAIIKATHVFYFLISLYGMKHFSKKHIDTTFIPLFIIFFSLNFFIFLVFSLQHQFLEARYVVPFSFLFLFFAASGLQYLFESTHRVFKLIVSIGFFIILFTDAIHTGPSKHYVIEAGQWLKQHTADATLYSNSPQVMYYADIPFDYKSNPYNNERLKNLLENKQLNTYDYLAIQHSQHDHALPNFDHFKPVITFSNKRKDSVTIFKSFY